MTETDALAARINELEASLASYQARDEELARLRLYARSQGYYGEDLKPLARWWVLMACPTCERALWAEARATERSDEQTDQSA